MRRHCGLRTRLFVIPGSTSSLFTPTRITRPRSRQTPISSSLRRQISVLSDENDKFRRDAQRDQVESRSSAGFLTDDGQVPGSCPCGGCKQYEQVLQSTDAHKAFQNHMNHTHRVCRERASCNINQTRVYLFFHPYSAESASCSSLRQGRFMNRSALPFRSSSPKGVGLLRRRGIVMNDEVILFLLYYFFY